MKESGRKERGGEREREGEGEKEGLMNEPPSLDPLVVVSLDAYEA
jgi:hypothetical protein